jgi:UrcA family protein
MRIQIAAAALAAATAPFAASAEEARESRTTRIVVAHSDLDLDRPADARIMAARLDDAARRACGGSPRFDPNYDFARPWAVKTFEECYAAAMDAALAELGAPRVSQVHARTSRTNGAGG